jgi:hypothetical protein
MPQFTPGDWHLVEDRDQYYRYAQIRSDAHPDYYIAEIGLGDVDSDNYPEDRANFRLMTQAVRMYNLLNDLADIPPRTSEWRDRWQGIKDAIDGITVCGAAVGCEHNGMSTCVVTWAHSRHRTECGCREPANAEATATP